MPVSPATIETDIYTTLRILINANLPTYTRTVGGVETEFTYTLVAQYPEKNPVFPMLVLNSADVPTELINLDASGEDYPISVQVDLYADSAHGIKAVEEAIQQLRATFIGNIETFKDIDNLIPAEDFWDTSNAVPFQDRNQLLQTKSIVVKFKLR